MDLIFEVADNVLFPWEIDAVLDEAVILCPAMKRSGCKMYAANAKRAVPGVCFDEEHAIIVAHLLNALSELA